MFFFFLSGFSFTNIHDSHTGQQGKREAISLSPLYHFHLLHKHLEISWAITADHMWSLKVLLDLDALSYALKCMLTLFLLCLMQTKLKSDWFVVCFKFFSNLLVLTRNLFLPNHIDLWMVLFLLFFVAFFQYFHDLV